MTKLPEPTLEELKDYQTFNNSPKFVVKYKEWLMREDGKHVKTIKHYGYFVSDKDAQDHFFSLPKYYQWRRNQFAREFISVLSLKDFLKQRKGAKQ